MARKDPFNPGDMMVLGMEMARLMFEAQTVITLRMLGMAGFWGTSRGEDRRMIVEKQKAFARAGTEMWIAAITGKPADKIAGAGVRTLRRTTSANVTRLTRKGPRVPRL